MHDQMSQVSTRELFKLNQSFEPQVWLKRSISANKALNGFSPQKLVFYSSVNVLAGHKELKLEPEWATTEESLGDPRKTKGQPRPDIQENFSLIAE